MAARRRSSLGGEPGSPCRSATSRRRSSSGRLRTWSRISSTVNRGALMKAELTPRTTSAPLRIDHSFEQRSSRDRRPHQPPFLCGVHQGVHGRFFRCCEMLVGAPRRSRAWPIKPTCVCAPAHFCQSAPAVDGAGFVRTSSAGSTAPNHTKSREWLLPRLLPQSLPWPAGIPA